MLEQNQSVIAQFHAARKYPLAAFWGAIMGMAIPVSVFWLSHTSQVVENPKLWFLVYAGLIFSGMTVCSAMFKIAEGNKFFRVLKAFAFTVLLEGTMTFSQDMRLTSGMLVLLIALNALSFAHTMVARHDNWLQEKQAEIDDAVKNALSIQKAEIEEKREQNRLKRKLSQQSKQQTAKRRKKTVVNPHVLPANEQVFENEAETLAFMS